MSNTSNFVPVTEAQAKAALSVASDLVGQMLGETPVLLGEFKE